MTDIAALKALLARIQEADRPDRELDAAIMRALDLATDDGRCFYWDNGVVVRPPELTASLDACAVLQAERLEGWNARAVIGKPECVYELQPPGQLPWPEPLPRGAHPDERLARLSAIVSAVIAEEEAQ